MEPFERSNNSRSLPDPEQSRCQAIREGHLSNPDCSDNKPRYGMSFRACENFRLNDLKLREKPYFLRPEKNPVIFKQTPKQ